MSNAFGQSNGQKYQTRERERERREKQKKKKKKRKHLSADIRIKDDPKMYSWAKSL